MRPMSDPSNDNLTLTTEIVAAYVSNNAIAPPDLPNLIGVVFTALASLGKAGEPAPAERPEPAVPIKRSIAHEYLVCLEDGKKVKTLKRYLSTRYGMTPDDYRQRWGLPRDYPMVAPAYAEMRSAMARRIGLGRKKLAPAPAPAPEPEVEPELPAAPVTAKRRTAGRKKAPVA
jgi:predicted transcriptional regulator